MVETDGTRDAGRRLPIACRVETGSREQPSERNWLVWTVVVYGAVAGVLAWGRWVAPLKADALTEPVWQGELQFPVPWRALVVGPDVLVGRVHRRADRRVRASGKRPMV